VEETVAAAATAVVAAAVTAIVVTAATATVTVVAVMATAMAKGGGIGSKGDSVVMPYHHSNAQQTQQSV
jgi:hypothetical protein